MYLNDAEPEDENDEAGNDMGMERMFEELNTLKGTVDGLETRLKETVDSALSRDMVDEIGKANSSEPINEEPVRKAPRESPAAASSKLGSIFEEILEEREVETRATTSSSAVSEVQNYLSEPTILRRLLRPKRRTLPVKSSGRLTAKQARVASITNSNRTCGTEEYLPSMEVLITKWWFRPRWCPSSCCTITTVHLVDIWAG
uniref:Uncharacterized protein n=1 Tax=Knipowitschia caucasica TaxID=637954 RepID=A0AAV2LR14_KNICA